MAEDLNIIVSEDKVDQYRSLIPQIEALLHGETDLVANLANVCAALKEQFKWFWVGFYLVKENQLVLGPFQGPVACTRIAKGKGVCGSAWDQERTLIIPDVDLFPGHIACSSQAKSEVVVPVWDKDSVVAVLDADADELSKFDEIDALYLEEIVKLIRF
ncbi:diguanylate cyclase [Mucilaginibacter sp. PAMC 26640]|nr:diguanylate cyclase [Mucilaginibacter sp. PAMC 26640]